MDNETVIVIGGGIAGLTAASILAKEGLQVTLLEAHHQTGGCAGTFRRKKYVFDVGATQVAGFEEGGIHARIFNYLDTPLPEAKVLDLACLVDLCDGSEPIKIWHDPKKWAKERKEQFPNSNLFWHLCSELHKINWDFINRNPILPTRNLWDFLELTKAIRIKTLASALLTSISVTDLLRLCNCNTNIRLKKFLDLQLKLYSQESANKTAALYGASVLQMAQSPLGLFHLQDSMQSLSEQLSKSILNTNGRILLRHKAIKLKHIKSSIPWTVEITTTNQKRVELKANDIIFTLPPQNLLNLMTIKNGMPKSYRKRLESLSKPSGALVFYGAIKRLLTTKVIPPHIQILTEEFGSLFISISQEGDGRAPTGEATVIASAFTNTNSWISLSPESYQNKKEIVLRKMILELNKYLKVNNDMWLHKELATPKSFAFWTGRSNGIVGGLGQNPSNFGIFGLASRTPIQGLWLCGDSIHPGEGTAGVSQSALMACRQLLASKGKNLVI